MCEFDGHWCNATGNLTKVKISPKNKNLVFCEDKPLIGKSDIKSDVFDILYFERRDIEEVIIPPFIRIISPYAFNFGQKLTKIEFPGDSKLQIIGESAFSYYSITSILIPKSVTTISSYAFYNCPLTDLTFSECSQLELIDNNAVSSSSLKSILIPSSVKRIGEASFCLCEMLDDVKFSENS